MNLEKLLLATVAAAAIITIVATAINYLLQSQEKVECGQWQSQAGPFKNWQIEQCETFNINLQNEPQ